MRFIIDNALSPLVAEGLRQAGFDAVHVRDFGMQAHEDEAIFDFAARERRTVISADTDFGTLLALRQGMMSSVILFRRLSQRHPKDQVAVLVANLPSLKDEIERGSIIVIEEIRIRIRSLPITVLKLKI